MSDLKVNDKVTFQVYSSNPHNRKTGTVLSIDGDRMMVSVETGGQWLMLLQSDGQWYPYQASPIKTPAKEQGGFGF